MEQPLLKPESSGDQHSKDRHHVLSGLTPEYGPSYHHRLI